MRKRTVAAAVLFAALAPAAGAQVPEPPTLWVPSPNYNNRPAGQVIDAVVIHTTEGTYAGAISWFQNPASQVSAHYVISSTGEITQMVALEKRAWHATYYNDRSIGIEMAGYANDPNTWTPENIQALEDLVAWLCDQYGILVFHPTDNAYDYPNDVMDTPGIVAHAQVQPWNKTDPGPYFPWDTFIPEVQAIIDAAYPPPPSGGGSVGTGPGGGGSPPASSGTPSATTAAAGNTRGGGGGGGGVCYSGGATRASSPWALLLIAALAGFWRSRWR